jgi:hypothetical protein
MVCNLECAIPPDVHVEEPKMSPEKKIVWILGAGFSRGLGGPLFSEMFDAELQNRMKACFPGEDALQPTLFTVG